MLKTKKTTEELLQSMSANNKKAKIQKLEHDEKGRLLLDPKNNHHKKWYNNDDDYEVREEDK